MGQAGRKGCEGNLKVALVHLVKIVMQPASEDVPHWRGEVKAMLASASDRHKPSMSRQIDVAELYRRVTKTLQAPGHGLPPKCPFTVADLVADEPDIDALLARLTSPSPP